MIRTGFAILLSVIVGMAIGGAIQHRAGHSATLADQRELTKAFDAGCLAGMNRAGDRNPEALRQAKIAKLREQLDALVGQSSEEAA
jgi:hypothetical protein